MKRLLVFIMAILTLVLFGCNCADTKTSPAVSDSDATVSDSDIPHDNAIEYTYYGGAPGTPLIIEDLDGYYKGVIINGDITAEEFEQIFGVKLLLEGDNIETVYSMASPYYLCYTSTLYYPDRENYEISITYLTNETLGIVKPYRVHISTGSFGRGISVGDSAEDIVAVFGEPIEEGGYSYYLNPGEQSYSIHFFVKPETGIIFGADIIYGVKDIMEEWSLTTMIL